VSTIPKLPIVRILRGALVIPWERRGVFLRALAFPGAAIVAVQSAFWQFSWDLSPWGSWLAWGVRLILGTVFVVICHRLVLLEPRQGDVAIVPRWTRRETRFLAWFIAVYALAALVTWVLLFAGTMVFDAMLKVVGQADLLKVAVPYAGMLLAAYLAARWAVVFPAAAIDVPTNLKLAWQQTRGNGLRMMVIVCALPWTLGYAIWWVQRDEPALLEVMLATAVGTILLAIEIAALSLAYRELSSTATSTP
jgi:hypothetical protein